MSLLPSGRERSSVEQYTPTEGNYIDKEKGRWKQYSVNEI